MGLEAVLVSHQKVMICIPTFRVTIGNRRTGVLSLILLAAIGSVRLSANTATCGGASINIPFTDVSSSNIFFCSIAAAYFSGLTNGTSATTYTPGQPVPREQMAAFVSRTLDQALKRGSRRAALNQWWMPTQFPSYARSPVGGFPITVAFDGADLWVANFNFKTVSRVRASDGRVLQTWTVAEPPFGVLVAQGTVYVTGFTIPGRLYAINPATGGGGGSATLITNQLGSIPRGIAFDGAAIWTADEGGSVSRFSNGMTVVIPSVRLTAFCMTATIFGYRISEMAS